MFNLTKKGQYFSLDVIISVIIFIFAFYLLLNYWKGVSSQLNQEKSFMYSEALRISELLLSVGDYYSTTGGWIINPSGAVKAGLATNESTNKLVYYSYTSLYNGASFDNLKNYANPRDPNYINYKTLLGTPLDFYVEINFFNKSTITQSIGNPVPDVQVKFGLLKDNNIPEGADVYKVRRIIYTSKQTIKILEPMVGYMDVYVWNSNQKSQ